MTMLKAWSEEDGVIVRKLWSEDGATASAIAAMFPGRTKNSVLSLVHRMKWPQAKASAADKMKRPAYAAALKGPPRKPRPPSQPKPQPLSPLADQPPSTAVALLERDIPLVGLLGGDCRWPTRRCEDTDRWLFCGAQKRPGSPYCAHHHQRSLP